MAAPLLQAQIDIDAPVAKVWTLVSDLSRMPQWSPQCRMMKALGPVRQGTRTINVNRRNRLFWPTTCTVTEVIPEKKLAFTVPGLQEWRPFTVAGLAVGALGTSIMLWQRRAVRRGSRGAQSGLS